MAEIERTPNPTPRTPGSGNDDPARKDPQRTRERDDNDNEKQRNNPQSPPTGTP